MNEKEQDFKATPRDESWFSRTGVEQLEEENVEIKEWKLQHGSRSGICLNKIRTQGPTLTLEKKQKNPEVLCQELKTRGSSDALRKTEERKEQRRNKSQKKKGKNKASLIGLWVGDIDGYDPPLRFFWPSYWNILIHLQSSPENHDENTTVASWVWHYPPCTSGLEAIWTFFYADFGQTDMINLSLWTTGYLMRSPTVTWHWPLATGAVDFLVWTEPSWCWRQAQLSRSVSMSSSPSLSSAPSIWPLCHHVEVEFN